VVFIENRNLYYEKELVPEGEFIVPIGEAEMIRTGGDVTVLTVGYARRRVMAALPLLLDAVEVEFIDLRSVDPLDMDTVLASVAKTGKVMIVQEAPVEFGIGAEIVRRIVAEGFDYLDSPPLVIGGKDIPTPFSPSLEDYILPSPEAIAAKIAALAEYKI
jgi:pyruvate/2-oxoglutarate/acetoin dehydrogenase E1 component